MPSERALTLEAVGHGSSAGVSGRARTRIDPSARLEDRSCSARRTDRRRRVDRGTGRCSATGRSSNAARTSAEAWSGKTATSARRHAQRLHGRRPEYDREARDRQRSGVIGRGCTIGAGATVNATSSCGPKWVNPGLDRLDVADYGQKWPGSLFARSEISGSRTRDHAGVRTQTRSSVRNDLKAGQTGMTRAIRSASRVMNRCIISAC